MHDTFASATAVVIATEGATFSDSLATTGLTMETGEAADTTVGATFSAWNKYIPAHSGPTTFDNAASTVSSSRKRLNVWKGSAVNALSKAVGSGDTGPFTITVEAGETYYVRSSTHSSSYTGTHAVTVTGQTTTVTRVPDLPASVTLIPNGTSLICRWLLGFATTWEIRIDGGAPISLGAVNTHTFTSLTVGVEYSVELRGTNSFGTSAWGSLSSIVFRNQIVWDDFDRANSASVVGAPPTGPTPAVITGVWGITGNELYSPTLGVLVWECGTTEFDLSATYAHTDLLDTGGLFFGQTAAATVDGWRVWFVGQPGQAVAGTLSSLARVIGSSVYAVASWNSEGLLVEGSVCRVVHKDRFVRVYIGAVEVAALELPEPMQGTRHGFRTTSTVPRWDNLSIVAVVDDPTPSSVVADVVEIPPADSVASAASFLYRGRDSKTQDISGGS